ncbi:hypothetical protein QQS21_010681 [Conoideocrella luteorostrata]|uniref:Uncharacterized protein n=1 Tax=Conoideocrella luteorostrata TaxID=1105319 RepID=A0AAJ0FP71_9HYPO|nr:hypothetical protein QQS21_010681 [Conoideocrella luteorostrata]
MKVKVGKAALLCAGLFECSASAIVGAAGPGGELRPGQILLPASDGASERVADRETEQKDRLNRSSGPANHQPWVHRNVPVNGTTDTSAPLSSSHSSASSSSFTSTTPSSVIELTYTIVSSTTTIIQGRIGSPSQDSSTSSSSPTSPSSTPQSPSLPSQQDPLSTSADPWPSDSTTRKGRTRTRSQSPASSPSSFLPSNSTYGWPSTDGRNSSTANGALATHASARKHRPLTNSTNALNTTFQTLTKQRPYPTNVTNGTITRTRTGPLTTSRSRSPKPVTVTMECPTNGQQCYLIGMKGKPKKSVPTITVTRNCTPFRDNFEPMTIYSIVHTSTVTFYGNRSEYKPPFSTIQTPQYCIPSAKSLEDWPTASDIGTHVTGATTDGENFSLTTDILHMPTPLILRPKFTFVTTDKNPAVVFPSDPPPPDYSKTDAGPYPDPVVHKTAPPADPTPEADNQPPPTFKVTAQGTQVVINTRTFSVGPGVTTVVTVDGGRFTIYPTAVVGEGATVTKPPPAPTAIGVSTPTSGVVGSMHVSLSGSQAVVDGVTMTMPPYDTTTMVNGHVVTISRNKIVVGTNSFNFNPSQAPRETDVVVAGGEMLTAVGKSVVVLRSKTITYGPGIPLTTEVIEGDTITVGPSGVFVHGMMIGGLSAGATDSRLEVIGGATITKVAPSIAIINGRTFTVGPGSQLTTVELAGQYFTIGPLGVVGSTLTLTYPFGSSIVTTIVPTGSWLSNFPIETKPAKGKDSLASLLRPSLPVSGLALSIAIGVLVFA